MLKRLIELKEVLTLAMLDDFEDFKWKHTDNVCKLLQLLKEATMALQEKSADAKLAVHVIKYLKVIASSETVLDSRVNDVMQKWINGNIIVNALLDSDGPFYDMFKDRMKNLNQTPQLVSADHAYIAPKKVCRFTEFVEQSRSDDFDIFSYMQNFRPTSCDPECLFCLSRLTKNYPAK